MLFWYGCLIRYFWDLISISEITLNFLILIANNLLLINEGLYSESTTSLWSVAYGEEGDLPSACRRLGTRNPPYPSLRPLSRTGEGKG